MSTIEQPQDQTAVTRTENNTRTNSRCKNNTSDQPIEDGEKTVTELDDGAAIETSNGDNVVGGGKATSEPAATDSTPLDSDQSEKEQSDDSQPGTALKKSTTSASDKPYSIFTTWQKRFIILAASVGSFISPLTSNIYFPALNTIASDLHVSITQINLTITTYMVGAWMDLSAGPI
jgi:hypothetical protein